MPHRGRKIIWRLAGGEQKIHTRSVFFIGGNMWKVYKYNSRFIQGELISKHSSESAAVRYGSSKENPLLFIISLICQNNYN